MRSHPSERWSRILPSMCGPGCSEGSRSQDTASWPRALNASRTTPENSHATSTLMAGRPPRAAACISLHTPLWCNKIDRPISHLCIGETWLPSGRGRGWSLNDIVCKVKQTLLELHDSKQFYHIPHDAPIIYIHYLILIFHTSHTHHQRIFLHAF